jgi:nicotinate-nucleotide adenylyltransferase
MRIALFGGSFDPPHRGHLTTARAAADHFALDRVLFAPSGRQPLKPDAPAASYVHRLAMVELAVLADSRFSASTLDAPRPDGQPNFTVDTLTALDEARAPGDELFCITGADAFLDLRRWRSPERLLELAQWIVVSRPGFSLDSLARLANLPPQFARVLLLPNINVDLSATQLRATLAAHLDCEDDLPPQVASYIRAHDLYTMK